jgi:hypothetical protein
LLLRLEDYECLEKPFSDLRKKEHTNVKPRRGKKAAVVILTVRAGRERDKTNFEKRRREEEEGLCQENTRQQSRRLRSPRRF